MEDFSCLIAFITDEYLWQEIAKKITRDFEPWHDITLQDAMSCIIEIDDSIKDSDSYLKSCWNIELDYNDPTSLDMSVWQGNVRHIAFLKPHRYDIDNVCNMAIEFGQFTCLRALHEQGYKCDEYTCINAIVAHDLKSLKYLHEHGCPWFTECSQDKGTTSLIWRTPRTGFTWYSKNTCAIAALHESFECLKYAHEQGCPWNWETCYAAKMRNNLECLNYARANGCPQS